jgi:hypothetical protein
LKKSPAGQDCEGPLVPATHHVNITALAGTWPASGERMAIGHPEKGAVLVAGAIATD